MTSIQPSSQSWSNPSGAGRLPKATRLPELDESTVLDVDAAQDMEDLNSVLPLEDPHHSPDSESAPESNTHPLSLLSTVGAMLKGDDVSLPISQGTGSGAPAGAPYAQEQRCVDEGISIPGWTRAQLRRAAEQKRTYFRYPLHAVKRDLAPSLDPILRGLLSEAQAEQLRTM